MAAQPEAAGEWIGWIVVDIIYIPLYAYKELYLTSSGVMFGNAKRNKNL